MRRRINITLPEETVRLVDRVAEKGNRSQLIDLAVTHYVASVGRASLRKRLKEGAEARARRDMQLVEDWFDVDNEAWQREDAK